MTTGHLRVLTVVILLLTHSLAFYYGNSVGKERAFEWFAAETEASDSEITFGRYLANKDIAANLKAGNISLAKCNADLMASTDLDALKECLSKETCRRHITSKVATAAPEIEGKPTAIPFDYIATHKGRKDCQSQ